MKKLILALICVVLLIIDNSIMPFIAISGYYPSLLFCFVITFSIVNGKWDAVYLGVVSGLLQDVYFMNAFGINSLTNLLLCYIAAVIGEGIFKNKRLIPILISFAATIVKYGAIFMIFYFLKVRFDFDKMMIIMAIYNLIFTFLIYNKIYKLSNNNIMKEQWDFRKK